MEQTIKWNADNADCLLPIYISYTLHMITGRKLENLITFAVSLFSVWRLTDLQADILCKLTLYSLKVKQLRNVRPIQVI